MISDEEHLARLTDAAGDIAQRSDRAFAMLISLILEGKSPQVALRQMGAMFGRDMVELLKVEMAARIGKKRAAAQIRRLRLSDRIWDNVREAEVAAKATIAAHLKGFKDFRNLAMALYDGYNQPPGPIKTRRRLPKYLRAAFGDDEAFDHLLRSRFPGDELWKLLDSGYTGREAARILAKGNAKKLKTAGLRAAYLDAIRSLEEGAGHRELERKLWVAWQERNRQWANRIAQTEAHRSHEEARGLELRDSGHAIEVRMSATHPAVDICDYHSNLNAWGLGRGIYPPDQAPVPPFHPHCRCTLRRRPDIDPAVVRFRPKAGGAVLRHFGADKIAGSIQKGVEAIEAGDPVVVVNAYKPDEYKTRKTSDL